MSCPEMSLYHGLWCEELCILTVGDLRQREGVLHMRLEGTGDKVCDLMLHELSKSLHPTSVY